MAETSAQNYQTTQDVVANGLHFARRVLARWKWGVAGLAISLLGAVAAAFLIRPLYQSQTTLMYRNTVTAESVLAGRMREETWRDKSARYRDLVITRANLEKVVRELNLYPEIQAKLGLVAASEALRADLVVGFPSGTVITMNYRSTEKANLIPVLSRFEQALKDQPVVDSVEEAKATKKFLEKQYLTAGEELAKKEADLAAFVASHPEFAENTPGKGGVGTLTRALQKEQGGGLASAGGGSPASKRTSIRRQIQRVEARLAALESPGTAPAPAPESRIVPEDQMRIDAAKSIVAAAQERLAKLSEQFTDVHPDVRTAKSDLARAQSELNSVRNKARTETLPSLQPMAPQDIPKMTAELREQLARLKREEARTLPVVPSAIPATPNAASPAVQRRPTADSYVESVVALETEWSSMLREVDNAREQHSSIGQRLFQADTIVKLVSLAGTGQIVTLDPAFEPAAPIGKSRVTSGLKAFGALMVVCLAAIMILTALDDRAFRPEDLRVGNDQAIMAYIPKADLRDV